MGYKQIESTMEKYIFEDIWKIACDEMGFEFAPCADFTEAYFLQNEQSKIVGTVELVPYNPKVFSTIEKLFPFSQVPCIKENASRTFEIDKLSLIKDARGRNYLTSFIYLFNDHAKRHNVKYYIALIELRFYNALKRIYGINIDQLGDPVIENESQLVPTMVNAEYICRNLKNYSWYEKLFKDKIDQR